MYLARIPAWIRAFYPGLIWSTHGAEKALYLTFDDGPTPGVTPWVLDTLKEHGAHATFFLLGKNAALHGDLLDRIIGGGHSIGNHTWDHLNAWRTPQDAYLSNVERAATILHTRLFRPPYGRITRAASRALRSHYDVVMWDVLSADFDVRTSEERCLRNVITNARPGSIIVFHDSIKAEARLRYALPRTLEHFARKGYRFLSLPMDGIKASRT